MDYEEFVNKVQERSGLESREDTEGLIETVVQTLAEPLRRDATNALAAQLPNPIKTLLSTSRAEPLQGMQQYDLEEFKIRIRARLGVTFQQGIPLARAVGSVLREAVSEGVMDQVRADLPEEYGRLFRDSDQTAG